MKVALLIPCINLNTHREFYVWETPSEKTLSKEFDTIEEAIKNKPDSRIYIYEDDARELIT